MEELDHEGRKEVFRALVGSHNYNLNTSESDRDYKVFVLPTFDDLYSDIKYSKSHIGKDEDLDVHDIRKLSTLLYKANVNFLELLFTEELILGTGTHKITQDLVSEIYKMRDNIARMNLQNLYSTCIGTFNQRMKSLNKGTEGTQHLVDKYGYNTKEAMHAIRTLNFIKRYADNNFTDFKSALWYKNDDPIRGLLLGIKNGTISKERFEKYAQSTLEATMNIYGPIYKEKNFDEVTNEYLIRIIKLMVKKNLFGSINSSEKINLKKLSS